MRRLSISQHAKPPCRAALLATWLVCACSGSDDPAGADSATGSGGSGTGGADGSVSGSGAGGSAASPGAAGAAASRTPPVTCADAARAFILEATQLDETLVPYTGRSALHARVPVAVDPSDNSVYVGFTREEESSYSAVIAAENSSAESAIVFPDAMLGGIAVTNDGPAALIFGTLWSAVARVDSNSADRSITDLFRSANLDDVGTRGELGTSRFAHVAETDELVAYFGHTRRYDDGVRHQGGYLAAVDGSGSARVIEDWFGSHNLDQRILVDGSNVAVLGLGDAFPKGIFFSFIEDPRTNVIYLVAADGSGTANGQLGGMVDLGDEIVVPFITNQSISQTLDPGPWPNPDPTIQSQIRDAARNGTDMGLLRLPKQSPPPEPSAPPLWLDPQRGSDLGTEARLQSLKSARYGGGELLLLAWAEAVGTTRDPTINYYTMVVDRDGTVCQSKMPLDAAHAFTSGDDIVRRPDGRIVWANTQGDRVNIVTLTP